MIPPQKLCLCGIALCWHRSEELLQPRSGACWWGSSPLRCVFQIEGSERSFTVVLIHVVLMVCSVLTMENLLWTGFWFKTALRGFDNHSFSSEYSNYPYSFSYRTCPLKAVTLNIIAVLYDMLWRNRNLSFFIFFPSVTWFTIWDSAITRQFWITWFIPLTSWSTSPTTTLTSRMSFLTLWKSECLNLLRREMKGSSAALFTSTEGAGPWRVQVCVCR